jgi:hypothetical protein
MWPRIMELVIAAWLAASPFVFGSINGPTKFWASDFAAAAAIAILALASFAERTRRAHVLELLVAAWLLGFGYLASAEPLPNLQNNILTAMVLMMVAIIPTPATEPPRAWKEFLAGSPSR